MHQNSKSPKPKANFPSKNTRSWKVAANARKDFEKETKQTVVPALNEKNKVASN